MIKKIFRTLFGTLIVFALLAVAYAAFIEPHWLLQKEVTVRLPQDHQNLDGLKIMLISDLHIKKEMGRTEKKIIKWAKETQPDLIMITGDFFERSTMIYHADQFVSKLPKTKIYAVLGNWEHWSKANLENWKERLAEKGVTLLVNQCVPVTVQGKKIVVAGVDDPASGFADLDKTLRGCPAGYRILLTHAPSIFENLKISEFDLTLAGHCHGGQVRFPKIGPLWLPEGCPRQYYDGLHRKGPAAMMVTAGVGTTILPIRFLARPEVILIRLSAGGEDQVRSQSWLEEFSEIANDGISRLTGQKKS